MVNRPVDGRLCRITLLLAAVCLSVAAQAEYRDPIDLAAEHNIAAAERSLLLDITRAGDRLIAVGERGHILFSDDHGQHWQQAQVPVRAHINAVSFSDAQRGWAVGEDAVILHTSDGGNSWQRQFDDRDADIKGPLLDVAVSDDGQHGLAIGVYNKVFVTDDAGLHWHAAPEQVDNLDEWHLMALAQGGEGRLYLASEKGLIFRSEDAGRSFSPLQTDHDGSFHAILARPTQDGADQLVLMGVGGVLFTSVDGGESWLAVASGTEAGLAGATWLDDGRALIVGADGVLIMLSADLKNASKTHTESGMPLSSVTQLSDGSLVMVGLGGIQVLHPGQLQH